MHELSHEHALAPSAQSVQYGAGPGQKLLDGHVVMHHLSHENAFAHPHNVFIVGQGRGGSCWWTGGGPGAGGPRT